jgi:cyclase
MKRLQFIQQLGMLTAGSIAIPGFLFRKSTNFTPLRNNVGLFSMQGGTIGWFVTDDAIVTVDSQFPDPARSFVDGIGEFGGGPEKILINTHHHGDHTGGNQVFESHGYRIIAHENVPALQQRAAQANDTEANQAYAEITFSDSYELKISGETITAKYYGRAHTSGDAVIWFDDANIAHMGDLIFNRLYPFIDRNSGALITGWIDLLETVYSEADSDTLFIFGHGNPEYGVTGNRDDLLVLRNFLSHLLGYTQRGIQAGKSRDEIADISQFEEFPGFVSPSAFLSLPRNIDVAWRELTNTD